MDCWIQVDLVVDEVVVVVETLRECMDRQDRGWVIDTLAIQLFQLVSVDAEVRNEAEDESAKETVMIIARKKRRDCREDERRS